MSEAEKDEIIEVDEKALEPLEITIDGDKVDEKPVIAAKPAEPELEGIETLKRQIETEKTARLAAETARRESEAKVAELSATSHAASVDMLNTAIENSGIASSQAKADYQKALEAGDYAKAAEAQERLADVRANLLRLQERKAEVETRGPAPQQRQVNTSDPVELAVRGMSRPSADWVRAHPEFIRDAALTQKMVRADARAFGEGVNRDTPEYFERVEQILGLREAPKAPEAKQEAQRVSVGAPVSRDTPSLATGQPKATTIRLSAEERATARDMGMTDREYAIEKAAAIREGQIGMRQ